MEIDDAEELDHHSQEEESDGEDVEGTPANVPKVPYNEIILRAHV